MLSDIAAVYKSNGFECILLTGIMPDAKEHFAEIVMLKAYNRSSSIGRMVSWAQFTIASRKWLLKNNFDNLFTVSNPPFALYLPYFTNKLKTVNRSILIYDLYPDILGHIMPGVISKILKNILSFLNKKSFKDINIYAPSDTIGKAIRSYTSTIVTTIYNWVDTAKYLSIPKKQNRFLIEHNLTDKFIVLYSGNLGKTHDISTIIKTASDLQLNEQICFVFIGHGEGMQLIKNEVDKGSRNIKVFNWQSEEQFAHSIAAGDIAWVSYKNGLEEFSIPSKLAYYFSTATPVISIGNRNSELAEIITGNNAGFAVENGNSEELTNIILNIAKNNSSELRNNAREIAIKLFSQKNASAFYHI
jgi:glycosyltransferase involved in cell wall biosynthesis